MQLRDWASSQHIVCLGCMMGFQGRRQKSLLGLADGGFEGASSAIRDPPPCLNKGGCWQSSLCRRHAREQGGGKREERPPVFGIYSQSPLTIHCIMETYSCLNRLAVSCSWPRISRIAVEPFITSHTKNTHESQVKTLLEYKSFSLGLAETQLLRSSVVIPGGCQNSCPDCPEMTKLKTTHEPKLPKGIPTIYVRRRVLLPQCQRNSPSASNPWSFTH